MKSFSSFAIVFMAVVILTGCSAGRDLPSGMADTYYGFLPCADCPGISYQLQLDNKGRYHVVRDYVDRESIFEGDGEYTFKNGQVQLWSDGKIIERYEYEGDRLIMLDGEGNRIETELAPYYTLYKGDAERSKNPDVGNISDPNINYRGTGNEPFWGIQITDENQIIFKGLMEDEMEFSVPVTGTDLSDDVKTIIYTGEQDDKKLTVTITTEACQDNMSGFYFPTRLDVSVEMGDKKYDLRGCGQFLSKYALAGSWVLESINGNEIAEEKKPTLGLHLPAHRITGNAGCNHYFGQIESLENGSISFGAIGATKMACPDMSLENEFLRFMSQDNFKWTISLTGKLLLESGGEEFLFGRVL